MVDVLKNQRTATRFRVLVEIADRQPAVSQEEIAEAIGVTSQAVSEYIRELTEEGYVEKEGRSRYRITKEGVDWLLTQAGDVRRYADRVTEDVLGGVNEDAAIAVSTIEEGDEVTLTMQDGLLHAAPSGEGPATGVATSAAEPGMEVGVTGFEGIIDLEPGRVTVIQVPPVRAGGSEVVELDRLTKLCRDAAVVLAAGTEAVVALRRIDREPTVTVAAGKVAAEAAERGVDVVVVATADQVGRVADPLRDAGTAYEVTEFG